ncbi:MAG: hypothetical protein PF569_02555 [Candidatus Woesearchaeota archaeon]|nr:hypothetical protein [Candidatus Woesearchaeota archaeon]
MVTKELKMTKTPIKSSSSDYEKKASAERSSLNKGLKSIKGDTSQIKMDTSLLRQDTAVIKAQNSLTHEGLQTATDNQIKLFSLNNKTLMSVGAVGSAVGGLAIALDEALKDILVVQVVIGLLLAIALVGIGLYVNERLKKQEKMQLVIAEKLGIDTGNKKPINEPVAYLPNEILNPQAEPISEVER